MFLSSPGLGTAPQGKIHEPAGGTKTGEQVKIRGETRNIEPGTYIWLAVDKPEPGLSWPKKHIPANTGFITDILEEGKEGPFRVSIYALNETLHLQWKEWKERERFGGMPMPPDKRRLDKVMLILRRD